MSRRRTLAEEELIGRFEAGAAAWLARHIWHFLVFEFAKSKRWSMSQLANRLAMSPGQVSRGLSAGEFSVTRLATIMLQLRIPMKDLPSLSPEELSLSGFREATEYLMRKTAGRPSLDLSIRVFCVVFALWRKPEWFRNLLRWQRSSVTARPALDRQLQLATDEVFVEANCQYDKFRMLDRLRGDDPGPIGRLSPSACLELWQTWMQTWERVWQAIDIYETPFEVP